LDIKVIRIVAPPTPACFHDRLAWTEYLHAAMEDKLKSHLTRPFVNGRFNEQFSHCVDCITAHRQQMCREGRCKPPVIKAPVSTEVEAA